MNCRIFPQRGFTLPEMIIVIVITGIIAGVVAVFIRAPVQGYFDMETRVALTDEADTALRRIGRDLHLALPNSVRLSGNTTLEFLQTSTGGRYRVAPPGNVLDPSLPVTTFDVLNDMTMGGKITTANIASGQVVIYNLSTEAGNPTNAYSGSNRAAIASATANSITLGSAKQFSAAPDYVLGTYDGMRFQVVDTPVTYRCDLAAGTLTRYWGYPITATQPNPPVGGSSALLATSVTACAFNYDPINERFGLLSMTLSLTRNNETVRLYHEVHVANTP